MLETSPEPLRSLFSMVSQSSWKMHLRLSIPSWNHSLPKTWKRRVANCTSDSESKSSHTTRSSDSTSPPRSQDLTTPQKFVLMLLCLTSKPLRKDLRIRCFKLLSSSRINKSMRRWSQPLSNKLKTREKKLSYNKEFSTRFRTTLFQFSKTTNL